ncbi:Methylated-DNA--protein-cysteine methyltransferase [Candidatus Sulfopaludibacter sp. SbA4]|nr:Methylated-DNA--protein-cysteine methyltransferase [Candidatus Sulfopaludibacter sp. SbA4]
MLEWTHLQLADGPNLRLVASGAGIRAIEFERDREIPEDLENTAGRGRPDPEGTPTRGSAPPMRPEAGLRGLRNDGNPLLVEAARQLRAYFAGTLREFHLPLDMEGTDFQMRVWRQLETIPYGETRSYAQIAAAIGSPSAVRAVGAANGANPVAIVVPCHRVIGSSGKLVGYGGGLPLKKRLLGLEGAGGWGARAARGSADLLK